jgi:gas vesicle protein
MRDTRDGLTCAAMVVVAGGVGLLMGLLFAPASGRKTRRVWLRRAREEADAIEVKVRRAAEDAGQQAKKYAEDVIEQGEQALSKLGAGG